MKEDMKKELIDLLCRKSFQYSDQPEFKLVSGKMSHYYVNCKPVTLHPRGMFLVGHLVFNALKHARVEGVGGLTFGADPIAIATAYTSEVMGKPLKAFSIRKTKKDHGLVRWIEGDLTAGNSVAIIDDVATTGGSTVKAVQRALAEGLKVVKAVVLVDRQEGGIDHIRDHVKDVSAVILRDDLVAHWKTIYTASK